MLTRGILINIIFIRNLLTKKNTDSVQMSIKRSWSGKMLIRSKAKQENADHENDDQENTDQENADQENANQKMLIRTSTDENNSDRGKR